MESRKPCPRPWEAAHPSHFPSRVGRRPSLFPAGEPKAEGSWTRGDLKPAVTRAPAIHFSSGLSPTVGENHSRQTTLFFWEMLLGLPTRSFRKLCALLKRKKKNIHVSYFKHKVVPPTTIFLYISVSVEMANYLKYGQEYTRGFKVTKYTCIPLISYLRVNLIF